MRHKYYYYIYLKENDKFHSQYYMEYAMKTFLK